MTNPSTSTFWSEGTVPSIISRLFSKESGRSKRKSMRRILLVEDDVSIEKLIRLAVSRLDLPISLHHVPSVDDALPMLGTREYDLIIADVFLGEGATGIDLFKFCRTHYPAVPFAVSSTLSSSEVLPKTFTQDQPVVFLQKPMQLADYRTALEKLLLIHPSRTGDGMSDKARSGG